MAWPGCITASTATLSPSARLNSMRRSAGWLRRHPPVSFQGEAGAAAAAACSSMKTRAAAATRASSGTSDSEGSSCGAMALDEARVGLACQECLVANDALEECEVGLHAQQCRPGKRRLHAPCRFRAVVAPDDELGDHGIVEHAHLVAFAHAGVEAHVAFVVLRRFIDRRAQYRDATGLGQELVGGILGAQAHFDRMAARKNLRLA